MRIEFVKEILNKANKIEEQTNILREQATSSDITFQMGEVFKDTEIQIRGLALAQIAMAGPVIGVVLGGGLGLPLLFFGAVATSFLAGGVIIIAGVAVAVVASLVALGYFYLSYFLFLFFILFFIFFIFFSLLLFFFFISLFIFEFFHSFFNVYFFNVW